jgi:hypothetical protein
VVQIGLEVSNKGRREASSRRAYVRELWGTISLTVGQPLIRSTILFHVRHASPWTCFGRSTALRTSISPNAVSTASVTCSGVKARRLQKRASLLSLARSYRSGMRASSSRHSGRSAAFDRRPIALAPVIARAELKSDFTLRKRAGARPAPGAVISAIRPLRSCGSARISLAGSPRRRLMTRTADAISWRRRRTMSFRARTAWITASKVGAVSDAGSVDICAPS